MKLQVSEIKKIKVKLSQSMPWRRIME